MTRLLPLLTAALLPFSTLTAEEGSPSESPAAEPAKAEKTKEIPFVEEKVGDISAPGLKVEGLSVGKKLTFDADWAKEHGAPLARPFELTVPQGDSVFLAFHNKEEGRGELANIQFATEDKKLKENVRLTPLQVPTEPPTEQRIKILAHLLMTQGVPQATAGWEKGEAKSIYRTKVGDYDAVVIHGFVEDPKRGGYFFKLVGVIEEGKADGLMAFAMIDPTHSEVKQPSELGSKGQAIKVIHSIEFLDEE